MQLHLTTQLALSNDESRPIMEGVEGTAQSDPGAGSSQHYLHVQGGFILFAGKVLNAHL